MFVNHLWSKVDTDIHEMLGIYIARMLIPTAEKSGWQLPCVYHTPQRIFQHEIQHEHSMIPEAVATKNFQKFQKCN